MRTLALVFMACFLAAILPSVQAEEPEREPRLWVNNKLTPEQPFPARVLAVSASWVGYTLLLEEITDKDMPLLCVAEIGYLKIKYSVDLARENSINRMKHEQMHTTFLEKPVAVSKFNWDCGVGNLGKIYGKEDALRGWYESVMKGQRAENERTRSGEKVDASTHPSEVEAAQ